jgi:hypothetical protein
MREVPGSNPNEDFAFFEDNICSTITNVSVLVSSAVDRGFDSRSGKTKHYKIDICCLSA